MKIECRGKTFDVYTEDEAKQKNITPIEDFRNFIKGDSKKMNNMSSEPSVLIVYRAIWVLNRIIKTQN